MNFELIPAAIAQTADKAPKGGAPMWPMLIAIFAVFYFFMLRPQQKKQKETQSMLNTVSKGDKIVTIGGICGTVMNIKEKKGNQTGDDIVVIKAGDTTKLEMLRSSIAKVITDTDENQA